MKTKFQYSRTYTVEAPKGRRKNYFFTLVERFRDGATFSLRDKDNTDFIPASIDMDGDVEITKFIYKNRKFSLRADRYIPKGYSMTQIGRLKKKEDALRDAHLRTIYNRDEVEKSLTCYCIACRTFFHPSEIDSYTDGGTTVICPYCDCDAVIGDACDFKLSDELLEQLHNKYFNYEDLEEPEMEVYVTTDLMLVEGTYRFNAVYAFKSITSVKSYEKYLKTTGEDHKLIITPTNVTDLDWPLRVITVFEKNGDLTEYKSTEIFDDYDEASDYKANLRESNPSIDVDFDSVKIHSRFTPSILHCGFANL